MLARRLLLLRLERVTRIQDMLREQWQEGEGSVLRMDVYAPILASLRLPFSKVTAAEIREIVLMTFSGVVLTRPANKKSFKNLVRKQST